MAINSKLGKIWQRNKRRVGPYVTTNDGPLQGKENIHIDSRVCYDAMEADWHKHVKLMGDTVNVKEDVAMIPVSVVESIMIENEQLRQSLYANQNTHYNRNIELLMQKQGHSTSQIIQMAKTIEDYTKGTIKSQDAFRIVYSTLVVQNNINFSDRKKKESKLQYCWRTGNLPLVSYIMCALKDVVMNLHRVDSKLTVDYLSKIAKKLTPSAKPKTP